MVKLPTLQPRGATIRGPVSSISGADVANVYDYVGQAFGSLGNMLEKKAQDDARIAGQNAVSRDANGNLKVDLRSNMTEANRVYNRSAAMDFTARSEMDAKAMNAQLQQEARGDPEVFRTSWKAYTDQTVINAPDKELRGPLRSILEREGQIGFTGVQRQKFQIDMANTKTTLLSSIAMKEDEMSALARQGGTDTPEYRDRQSEVRSLYGELSSTPEFQFPDKEREMKLAQLESRNTAEAILGQADRAIQTGGIAEAAKLEERILTDEKLALSPAERRQYAGLIRQTITGFKAEQRANLAPLKEEAKEVRKKWEQGAGFDDPADDDLINNIAKNGDLATAQELRNYRRLQRTLSEYRQLGDAEQVAILENAVGNANRSRPTPSRPVSVSPSASTSMESAMNHLVGKGLSKVMAAGIIGNLMQESGLNPLARNPGDGNDGSDSIGLGQWNGARARALKAFAAANGASPDDVATQLDFVLHELETTENAAYQRLKAATTVDEAVAAMIGFERPQGWTAANPRGGHGWSNRLQYGMKAAEMAGITGELLGVSKTAAVPSQLLKEYQQEVTSDLRTAKDDWKRELDKGNVPDAESLGLLTRQLALVDDQNLRREYADLFSQSDAFKQFQTANPAEAEAVLSAMEAGVSNGASLAEHQIVDAARRGAEASANAWRDNPLGQGARLGMIPPSPTLDLGNSEKWGQTFSSLQRSVSLLQARGVVGNISALPPQMQDQVSRALTSSTPADAINLLGSMATNLNTETYRATLNAIASKGDGKVMAAAGALVNQNPEVAESILRGQALMKENSLLAPRKTDSNAESINALLPIQAFGPTLEGARQSVLEAATARYADLSHQAGDTSGELDDTRMETAINEVTGGLVDMNGYTVIAPRYGMSQRDFDSLLGGLSATALAGAVTSTGQPVSASDLRNEGRLRAVADGRYVLEFGNPEYPTYAMRAAPHPGGGADLNSVFVLDLRGQ